MTLISFTIDGTSYQAEEGMTWEEWVASDYNTDGYIVSDGSSTKNKNCVWRSLNYNDSGYFVVTNTSDTVLGTDYITENLNYKTFYWAS